MYLEDKIQEENHVIEIVAQKELWHNDELFMIICLEHDKTAGYYQTSFTYYTANQVLKRSNKTYELLYAIYGSKNTALRIFNDFVILDTDIITQTEENEDL